MFNAQEFKALLTKAIGDRNFTDFAKTSKVNRTYISKYINEGIERPPSPYIIRKIADNAQNNVTYEDLMFACGHLTNKIVPSFVKENIRLIRGDMTYEEMSEDIAKKFNNPVYGQLYTASYIKDIENGNSTPAAQRINLFSLYAGVSEDFFCRVNTLHDLEIAREEYRVFKELEKINALESKLRDIAKTIDLNLLDRLLDFLKESNINLELIEFIMLPENLKYIEFARNVKAKGINPDDVTGFSLKY